MLIKRKNSEILSLLNIKNEKVNVILDTDTYNEIDDQFALIQMLFSEDRINVKSINAAPFSMNSRSDNAEKGMELSYDEIFRLLEKINFERDNFVFKGSKQYVGFDKKPISSAAADNIIESSLKCSEENPLYVIAIGAISNVASAILKEPEIIKKIVVVWLGGNALYWPQNSEFNLKQDVGGAQVLFDSGVSLVMIPCKGVTSHLTSTVPEIEKYVEPHGEIGKFLSLRFKEYNENAGGFRNPMRGVQTHQYLYLFNPWSNGKRTMATATNGTATWKRMLLLAKQNENIKKRVDVMRFRTTEELYDINKDPDCLHNLAQSKDHQNTIKSLRKTLQKWMKETNDHALVSFEPNNSEVMEAYVQSKQLESDNRRKKNKKASSSKVKKSS